MQMTESLCLSVLSRSSQINLFVVFFCEVELFISKFSYAVSLNDSITCFAISNQSHSSQFSNVLD